MTPVRHRLVNPFQGQLHRGLARQNLAPAGLFQSLARVAAQFFLDALQRGALAGAAVFHRRTDDAAGIGDKIGNAQDALVMQDFFCRMGDRDIGTLDYHPGF